MSEEEKPKKKEEIEFKLGPEDSALIVRTDGNIELVSRELQDKEDNYLGDLEDLNRTFTLVLAFADALENEHLYQHIFHNLNHVLHRQWKKLPPEEKERIKDIRLNHLLDLDEDNKKSIEDKQEWLNRWREEIERGRAQLEEYMNTDPSEREGPFGPENRPFDNMEIRKRKKRKKINPLAKMKDVKWHPYDDTLKANRVDGRHSAFRGDWNLDNPPDEED